MKRAIPVALVVVALSAASAVGFWLWARSGPPPDRSASMSYSLEAVYTQLPEDDHELQAWLEALPGYRSGDVGRSKKRVSVHFELVNPQPPDALGATLKQLEERGYREPGGYSGRFGRKRPFDFQTLRVEYRVLPADDEALRAWLGKNPGLRSAKVERLGRVIAMELVATEPPVPGLLGGITGHCKTTGYEQQVGYIRGYGPYR